MQLPSLRFVPRWMMIALFLVVVPLALAGLGDPLVAFVDESTEPMTIGASCEGRFARGYSWYLSVNSAGEAELTVAQPETKRRTFVVPRQRLAELRKAIEQERFFDLADEYGRRVTDGSTRTITVVAGGRAKSVRLRYLMDLADRETRNAAKHRETARAVRISMMIRGWFDDADAVDLRPYDRRVLDAANDP